jgi:DASS family divalent anion:Na+ symporter
MRPALLFSGFVSAPFWILLCVLFYGLAIQSTGLARRLALYVLSVFPATYRGLLTAFLVIGMVLSLGIPSMTVRAAIMAPVAWALTQSLALKPRSAGAALIVLTAIEMAVLPGCAFLTGSLYGPMVESLFHSKGLELSWFGYTQVMAFPVLLLCSLIVVVNPLVVRPESPLEVTPRFAAQQLTALGRLTRHELTTAVVVVISTAYWATGQFHHLPSVLIGFVGLAVLVLSGIVRGTDVRREVPWRLLFCLGAVFGLVNVIETLDMTRAVAAHLAPAVRALSFSPLLTMVIAAVAMFLARFADPTGFVALAVLFLALADATREFGLPPMLLVASLLLASAPFWLTYQNMWVVIGESVTGNQAFTRGQRVRLACTYSALTLLTLPPSLLFWRAVGLLS